MERLLPLSLPQNRLWLLSQLENDTVHYHIPLVYKLIGNLHIDLFEKALNYIINRHESLRSIFVLKDNQPWVPLLDANTFFPLIISDLRQVVDKQSEVTNILNKTIHTPFNLSHDLLICTHLIYLDKNEYIFILNQHHIITDGWSITIFFKELSTVYNELVNHRTPALASLTLQYPDYAVWQQSHYSSCF
ncbi:condensation domain-containing protein [Photorhabdus stackebrandtii]|uniref:condensation domain-containing protein n=1 Tax=Photorhabdus stackebrandtii TaxID=1123042 RepID=UPI00140C4958|nr:condensation domain-containing protein [Photorhabdus stackebrandtii]